MPAERPLPENWNSIDDLLEWLRGPSTPKPKKDSSSYEKDKYRALRRGSIRKLGREGYCSLAARVLLTYFDKAQLCGIINHDNHDAVAHFFLYLQGRALDICGVYKFEYMMDLYKGNYSLKPVDTETLWDHMKNIDIVDRQILTPRFAKWIEDHMGKWNESFPQRSE